MSTNRFGEMPDGTAVESLAIAGGGLSATFLTYGAVLQDVRLSGHDAPLVLGLNSLDDYLKHSNYFGATAGRVANRIGAARFTLDGQRHVLEANNPAGYQLHGGSNGLGKRVWKCVEHRPDSVTFRDTLPDGHMGYPGQLEVTARFSLLDGGIFDIEYTAETDAPTLCNIAHHSYWNLTGGPDLAGHRMQVSADRYTVVDDTLIPTGELADVAGTPYDMRDGADLGNWPAGLLLDHNYCLSDTRQPIRKIATLSAGSLAMDIHSTEPGLQVYDGAKLNTPVPGLDGRFYRSRSGVALEPQVWPDAINHAGFPSAVLRPGQTYRQHSQFRFRRT